jgi:hypothetical protein
MPGLTEAVSAFAARAAGLWACGCGADGRSRSVCVAKSRRNKGKATRKDAEVVSRCS